MSQEEEQDEVVMCRAPGEHRQEDRREAEPTIVKATDQDFIDECEQDSFQPFITGEKLPNIKITTSGEDEEACERFGKVLEVLIPNSKFEFRETGVDFKLTRQYAYDEGYTDLLVITPVNNEPYSLLHVHLPDGPCAMWRVTTIKYPEEIIGHGVTSEHYPEVIMKRFTTNLGHRCARMLRALFPAEPQLEGRRVVTFLQQRDFIFCRSYRYIFDSIDKVRMQELGPRFTLRLLWMQEGGFDPSNGQYTFYRRIREETTRRKWWL